MARTELLDEQSSNSPNLKFPGGYHDSDDGSESTVETEATDSRIVLSCSWDRECLV